MAHRHRLRTLLCHHRQVPAPVRFSSSCTSSSSSLSPKELAAAVEHVAQARIGKPRTRIGHAEGVPALDGNTAYDVQDALHDVLVRQADQGEIVGTKIGCTTRVMQEFLGMSHPCCGAIFAATLHSGEGTFTCDGVVRRGVECEIAVRLGQDIGPRSDGSLHTRETVEPAVRECMAAIEVVDDRYVNFQAREPGWEVWVADDFFGAGAVIAASEPGGFSAGESWRGLNLAAVEGEMKINGEIVGAGVGADIINGHPLEALVWLANHQVGRGHTLKAGQIVMLGSVVQTKWCQPGDVVEVAVAGLGSATAHFV